MHLDPSLAFTAIRELRPHLTGAAATIAVRDLSDAMTASSPPDRWEFARHWLDVHYPGPPGAGPEAMIP